MPAKHLIYWILNPSFQPRDLYDILTELHRQRYKQAPYLRMSNFLLWTRIWNWSPPSALHRTCSADFDVVCGHVEYNDSQFLIATYLVDMSNLHTKGVFYSFCLSRILGVCLQTESVFCCRLQLISALLMKKRLRCPVISPEKLVWMKRHVGAEWGACRVSACMGCFWICY